MTRATRRSTGLRTTSVVTIHAVAERAGVSTATVSRALSGAAAVRPAVAAAVQEAARELGYVPNRIARSLRVRRTRLAGVLIPDVQNPFFTAAVRGVEDVLQPEGWTLLLGNSDDHPEREHAYLATLRAEGAAGVVLVPGQGAPAYRAAMRAGLALVAIDRAPRGLAVDQVTVANRSGAEQAVRHLIGLGHSEVAFIGGPSGLSTAEERHAGCLDALRAHGCEPLAVERGDFRPAGGRAAAERLLARCRPRALFVANDLMTLGVYEALRGCGLRVPEDVAVVGFDDAPWAAWLAPPLTTVAQPAYELGQTAGRLLLERLAGGVGPPARVILEPRLVVRASCGARAGGDARWAKDVASLED